MRKMLKKPFLFVLALLAFLVSCTGADDVVTYNVSVSSNAFGVVVIENHSGNSAEVVVGSNIKLTAIPNENCYFTCWFIAENETPVSTEEIYVFTVNKPVEIKALFNRYPMAIDLGLPSGTKWAEFNVGANAPSEYGNYYAWGETANKKDFTWESYLWCKGSAYTIVKYCDNNTYGSFDCKILLDLEDDMANAELAGEWRMPTIEEQNELLNECVWEWTSVDEVNGYNVIGPNGNSVFLPAAGFRYGNELYDAGRRGCYWAGSLATDYCYKACGLGFYDSAYEYNDNDRYSYGWYYYDRYLGQTIRPVCR